MLRIGILVLTLIFGNWGQSLVAQTAIRLDDCNIPYVDPQEAGDNNGQNRDTLFYETFFAETNQARKFYVDINAFGGQQTDRTKVFAILPDSSLKLMGSLEFGNCANCLEGFALVDNNEVQVSAVADENTMNMWLQSLAQPTYQLPGNLQTLTGVGRISGTLPTCAIGLYVEYSVYSNPNNASTEFATYIHCTETIGDCAPDLSSEINCTVDSLYLNAAIEASCIPTGAQVHWTNKAGWEASGTNVSRKLTGNLGLYYFEVIDECCTITDSILIDIPAFAMAGDDIVNCTGESIRLSGSGGTDQFWEYTGNPTAAGPDLQLDNVSIANSGYYIFHAFDADGCEDTDSLLVTVNDPSSPQLLVNAPCFGDTLLLQLENESAFQEYTWNSPDGITLTENFIPDFQVNNTGNYGFSAIDTTGCSVAETVVINGAPLPEFEYLIEPNCDSTRVYLLPEAFSYVWSDGQIGERMATLEGGDFQLSITDAVGCQTITNIAIPAPEGPEYTLVLEQAACPGEGASLSIQMANPNLPVIFSIDSGETYSLSPDFTGLAPGVYGIEVQDDLGCTQTTELIIPAPDSMGVRLPIDRLDVRPNTPILLEAETTGNIVAYQWVPEFIDTGGPNTDFIATQDMDIRLVVEDAQGCRAVASLPLSIVLGDIYVPDAFSPNGDGANDGFTFFSDLGSGEQILLLQVFDRYGTLVFSTEEKPLNEENLGWDGRYNGRMMPEGVYVYHGMIQFGNGYIKRLKGDVTLVR